MAPVSHPPLVDLTTALVNEPTKTLSETQHQAIFDRFIKRELFANARSLDKPHAVVFGGQPGSGKTAAVDAAAQELRPNGGVVQIIGDDFRAYHPQYARLMREDDKTAAARTDRDTGRWVEKAIAHAIANRHNVVIEGTFRDGAKVAKTLQDLQAAGYTVEARVLAVPERWSLLAVLQRYEAQKLDRGYGRMTAPESHAAAYLAVPLTLAMVEREQLADRVAVLKRGGEVLYRNERVDGKWQRPPGGQAAVENERARPWTPAERADYVRTVDRVADLVMNTPGRNATSAERVTVANLLLGTKELRTGIDPYKLGKQAASSEPQATPPRSPRRGR